MIVTDSNFKINIIRLEWEYIQENELVSQIFEDNRNQVNENLKQLNWLGYKIVYT